MKIKKLSLREYLTYFGIILLGILLDQGTKHLAFRYLKPIGEYPLIAYKNILYLTYAENRGAAFSMFADNRWVFIAISFIMLAVLIPYLFLGLTDSKLSAISVAMIISGGIGNMIDRLSARASVIDFIDVRIIHFAIFNGADSFVCVGSGLLILAILLEMKAEKKAKPLQNPTQTTEETEQSNEDKSV